MRHRGFQSDHAQILGGPRPRQKQYSVPAAKPRNIDQYSSQQITSMLSSQPIYVYLSTLALPMKHNASFSSPISSFFLLLERAQKIASTLSSAQPGHSPTPASLFSHFGVWRLLSIRRRSLKGKDAAGKKASSDERREARQRQGLLGVLFVAGREHDTLSAARQVDFSDLFPPICKSNSAESGLPLHHQIVVEDDGLLLCALTFRVKGWLSTRCFSSVVSDQDAARLPDRLPAHFAWTNSLRRTRFSFLDTQLPFFG
jgi:hypothetical protein